MSYAVQFGFEPSQTEMPAGEQPAAPVATEEKPKASMDLWSGLSSGEKLLIGGLAAGAFVLFGVLIAKRRKMKPNRRKFGRTRAPAKYRKLGVVRRTQYAWPQGYMYPIHDPAHTRAAASRFARWKRRYPPRIRKTIARRIDQAKRRFSIGPYREAS